MCQMSVTKPHIDMGIYKNLYIIVKNLCNLAIRHIFNKLILRLTEYTSCEVGNPSKVVLTIETTCHEK